MHLSQIRKQRFGLPNSYRNEERGGCSWSGVLGVRGAAGCSGLPAASSGQAGLGTCRVPAAWPAVSPAGPCVTAHSLPGALRFPGLVIIVPFLPRNAAPGPGPGATLLLADMAEPPAPWCQAMETQIPLEREPPAFNTSQASPSLPGHAVGLTSWHRGQWLYPRRNEEHNVLEGDSGIIYSPKIKGGMQKGVGRFKADPVDQHHVDF